MPRVPKVVVVKNTDGSFSSEKTTSVSNAALNEGRETLIPTIIEGRKFSVPEATKHAIGSGLVYPDFESPEKATAFATERSRTGGATKHGFLGKVREMPKGTKKSITQENLEFQKKEFPARIAAVKKGATSALAADKAIGKGHKPLTTKERGRHQGALKAAERVGKRLAGGAIPSRSAVTKPGKKGSTPSERRKVFETVTGTGVLKKKLAGINELITAGRKKKK